jgi:starch phosphorylase
MQDCPVDYEGLIQTLKELAMDLHWTWNHATDKIWKQLDQELWESTNNPLVVLQTVSHDRICNVLEDPIVREIIIELSEIKRQRPISPAWFQNAHPGSSLSGVSYFSMEYMLSEALPIYSGGLGNVSGDLLKTASDLGVPVTGIGLLYQQGYPRQVINADGTQQYVTPFNDPGQLPISPLRTQNGEWLRIKIDLPGNSLWLRTWQVQVGRVNLLLLDSNDAANFPLYRGITGELYGGDGELRLLQEIVLGIGGWRLLKAIDAHVEVCHLNEGHSAFVILERVKDLMEKSGVSFRAALHVVRSGMIFTTHTAIGAGFDRFPPELIKKCLGGYITSNLKISVDDFLALGRIDRSNVHEYFNTGFFAVRGSAHVNAVSKLHKKISQQLFAPLFPGWTIDEMPIGSITNGVHMSTWDSPQADKLWTEACGKERWLGSLENLEKNINDVNDERLWTLRNERINDLIEDVREHYAQQLATIGASNEKIEAGKKIFEPSVLTLGFARRFVAYKRPDLLLQQAERLHSILSNKESPVQLVLAGKAHPDDVVCKEMIRKWIQFIDQYEIGDRVVFLSDYDMLLTAQLVQGVDVWINTPRRPWEACGTSGMKVLVNGGLNLSELDGWWDEAYTPEVGWTFGDRRVVEDDAVHDKEDAERLYKILEEEILPEFYERGQNKIPAKWVNRMRNSMATLTSMYSSNRSLQEYTEKYYLPAAALYKKRSQNKGAEGETIIPEKYSFDKSWKQVHFGNLDVQQIEDSYQLTVPVFLNGINCNDIKVEVYANAVNGNTEIKKAMELVQTEKKEDGALNFTAFVPADRPVHYYTPRIIGINPLVSVPLEWNYILWQH